MNTKYRFLLYIALIGLTFISCDEDKKEVSDVAIFITPSKTDTVKLNSGDIMRYTIKFYSVHQYVKQLKVSSFDVSRGKTDILDTIFSAYQEQFYFDYTAPTTNRDSLTISLNYEAWDDAGSKCEVERVVLVRNAGHLIDEKTGIVLRSSQSGMSDALSFRNPSQTFNWHNSPDSVYADLYLIANETFDTLTIGSKTKAKFVRMNEFDYPSASINSVQAVYEYARRSDFINDLKTNDIILVGHESNAEGVLQITNIIRTGTNYERCLQLSFKGISTVNNKKPQEE